jgi:adenylate cyclase
VFLFFLLDLPRHAGEHQQHVVNIAAFGVYLLASLVLGQLWGRRTAAPMARWLETDFPANDLDRLTVLRQPLRQTRVDAVLWLVAVVAFTALNLPYDALGALDIGVTILLGGVTTCGLAYLITERTLRPVVTRAMLGSATPPPVLLGVTPRLLLAWTLGTGVPLAGIGLGVLSPGRTDTLSPSAVLFLVATGLVFGLLAIAAAAGAVSDPIRSVATALRHVGDGRLEVTVPVYDASEVGGLQSGFNTMVEGLRERERLRDLFGRQVGDDVARLALEGGAELGGELRDVAVLFVDVVGSTELAIEVDPQEVVRRLNAFFAVVITVVQDQGGWVNKFEGDAALCIFGAPVELQHPATCALSAARELAVQLRGLEVAAAIGVSAGPVVAGHVGAESRFEYTVIGDPVNSAARLTELAKTTPGCVLADAALLAGSEEAEHWAIGESVVLRGRTAATTLARPH